MSVDAILTQAAEGVVIRVHVQPKARREQIVGLHDGRLKLTVTEPPDQGRANAAVIRLLADRFDIPRVQVQILRGATSRKKDVLLQQQEMTHVLQILDLLLRPGGTAETR